MPIMRPRCRNFIVVFLVTAALFWPLAAPAQTCTTQSEMAPAERTLFEQTARSLGSEIMAGNTAAVRSNTIAAVATKFDPIAATIEQVAPQIQNATLTVDALYRLNAANQKSDGSAASNQAQFFCSVTNSALLVTVTIPNLPAGNFLLAILHATGVEHPQQITLLLQNDPSGSASWKVAGLYTRPMTMAGHDGVWFWKKARSFVSNKQNWNAYFYYNTAALLLNPVDFLSSPNLTKLLKEQHDAMPPGLPGKKPMIVNAGGESLDVTGLHPASFSGQFDLVVNYNAKGVSDPVATRAQIVSLMKALLTEHPEFRDGFHGLWVYAHYENGQSFAIELPMNQIE
jgi:hypothetical protein